MRRTLLATLALVLFLPLAATAQEWTDAQQEIWEWEQSCWETWDLETVMDCFHDDFVGWGSGSTVPSTKADRRPFFARWIETLDNVFVSLKPLNIEVHGDVAVILYIATYTTRNRETGQETTITERWLDVAQKRGDRWGWISDHGVTISSN